MPVLHLIADIDAGVEEEAYLEALRADGRNVWSESDKKFWYLMKMGQA